MNILIIQLSVLKNKSLFLRSIETNYRLVSNKSLFLFINKENRNIEYLKTYLNAIKIFQNLCPTLLLKIIDMYTYISFIIYRIFSIVCHVHACYIFKDYFNLIIFVLRTIFEIAIVYLLFLNINDLHFACAKYVSHSYLCL